MGAWKRDKKASFSLHFATRCVRPEAVRYPAVLSAWSPDGQFNYRVSSSPTTQINKRPNRPRRIHFRGYLRVKLALVTAANGSTAITTKMKTRITIVVVATTTRRRTDHRLAKKADLNSVVYAQLIEVPSNRMPACKSLYVCVRGSPLLFFVTLSLSLLYVFFFFPLRLSLCDECVLAGLSNFTLLLPEIHTKNPVIGVNHYWVRRRSVENWLRSNTCYDEKTQLMFLSYWRARSCTAFVETGNVRISEW